ncbi:MAG: hypothetical protein BWY79_02181 [Actinobacteria bacterium ADurb.Bin444]|nr:MAG: hypothetical protein BWY79_02181 [Actinobacteria bacterium ADurb.Bin444]
MLPGLVKKGLGVLRPGQFLPKVMQPKARVDTLPENSPGLFLPIDNGNALRPGFTGTQGGCQARRATTHNYHVVGLLSLYHVLFRSLPPARR